VRIGAEKELRVATWAEHLVGAAGCQSRAWARLIAQGKK